MMFRLGRCVMALMLMCGLALEGSSQGVGSSPATEADTAEAFRLSQRVQELYKAGRYAEAVPLAERWLAIEEKYYGPENPYLGTVLNSLALLYEKRGNGARAESLLQRAVANYENRLGKDHPYIVPTLNNLASLHKNKGDHAGAELFHRRALAIEEKVFSAEQVKVASSLNNLARQYRDKGDHARAELLYRAVLAIWEKAVGPNHESVGTSLNNLALLYFRQGDFARAEPLFLRALQTWEKALGENKMLLAVALNEMGQRYQDRGDYAHAEPLFLRVLEIVEQAGGPEHPDVAPALNNLAEVYKLRGDYGRAEPLYQRALEIREKVFGKEHERVANSLNNLAALIDDQGDQGDYTRAESLYRRALGILEKERGPEHPDVASVMGNLALLLDKMDDQVRAEPLHLRALEIREKAFGKEHPDVANSLGNLALMYDNKGDYERARPLHLRVLAIREKAFGPDHPDTANALGNLGLNYLSRGEYTRAVQFQRREQEIREHNLSLILLTGSESQKQLYLNTLYGTTGATVSLHARYASGDQPAAALALTTILRRKGRALDAMSDQIGTLRRRAAPGDQQLLDQLALAQSKLARLRLAGSDADDSATPEEHRARDQRLTTEIENLQAEISRHSTEFRVQNQPVTVDAVQQVLPPDAALVELFAYLPFDAKATKEADRFAAPRYVAYVLKKQGIPTFVDLGPVKAIDGAVEQFVDAISNPASVDAKETSRVLDEMVAHPIRKLLGNIRNVFISPDGKLNLVPFAALVDETGKYLVENYVITYLTSGRDLLRLNVPRQSKQAPVIIASPTFDVTISGAPENTSANTTSNLSVASQTQPASGAVRGRRSGNMVGTKWSELPGTALEAKDLKALMPNARVLTGKDATEGALKQVVAPRILHVATHGFFLPDQPSDSNDKAKTALELPLLRSGLVLAGANTLQGGGDEDGVLTALEAAGLNLWGTQLVVLSACETGVGDVRSGEGVYGLRRALVLAGAQSQVMTLWKVDDTATSEVIIEYYRRLQAGEGRTEALRQVQLEFLQRKTRQHPFFWAGFILNGDWRSMRE